MQPINVESPAPGRPDGQPAGPAWSVRIADSALARYAAPRWHYEDGVLLRAIAEVDSPPGTGSPPSAPGKYRLAGLDYADRFVAPDGSIRPYRLGEHNLDQVLPGRLLFAAYRQTREERYRQAICLLREQLRQQPRTIEGGFWHKLIYPQQMWLDGLYMAEPFLAEYAAEFDEPDAFDEVARQILLIGRHAHDGASGLLYHAWDASRQQRWADPATGCSPHFWGRAVGWYLMALAEVLDLLPASHGKRAEIAAVFARTADAVCQVQDADSGLWFQVLDQAGRPGNYLEASASCMFVYSIAAGIRQGYVRPERMVAARAGYLGILSRFVEVDAAGEVHLHGTCITAGLGGNPYRDGSFEYYVNEKIVTDDYKGVGPLILAALEMERAGQ